MTEQTPPNNDTEPILPRRTLRIKNEYPGSLYNAIEDQYGKASVTGMSRGFVGETIGFVRPENPKNPLKEITTTIHGNLIYSEFENIPDKPNHRRGIGEKRKEFNIETTFKLPDHTFLDDNKTSELASGLKKFGYETQITSNQNGGRKMTITTPDGSFDLFIGWPNPDSLLDYHKNLLEKYKTDYASLVKGKEYAIEEVVTGKDRSNISLEIANSHPNLAPPGIPQETKEQVIRLIHRSKDLTEVVATALILTLTNGKQFSEIKMDWLPPDIIKEMGARENSSVVGRVDATVAVETKIQEDFGLERLVGLAPETLTELRRIRDKLKEPERANFMKKYGFKQSNGAVFWGITGTGKTLAGEALAEEVGCERVVLKIDELKTAYMHDSAHRIGEKIREIKTQATENNKQVIIQIDEADTILRPVDNSPVSGRDASEIRAVLLTEFQEPSNVFYILTTNLDPRDPRQADPSIVRNQRLGNLVGFGLPEPKGRQEIFEKETAKRTGDDMKWENINYESLVTSTEGFSPADIQEILSIAVSESYNMETGVAFVNQENMEIAINVIKSRKLLEEKIKKPIGF